MKLYTHVRIDHDIPFSAYDITIPERWLQKVEQAGYIVKSVYVRRSTGNNTHMCLKVSGDLLPFETLLIRAIMHDDARRIRGDLERLALKSPVFGLLFDLKIDDKGNRHYAGVWKMVR